jgi:TRAP-type C4-dicarboxylate transport system permease large subunit
LTVVALALRIIRARGKNRPFWNTAKGRNAQHSTLEETTPLALPAIVVAGATTGTDSIALNAIALEALSVIVAPRPKDTLRYAETCGQLTEGSRTALVVICAGTGLVFAATRLTLGGLRTRLTEVALLQTKTGILFTVHLASWTVACLGAATELAGTHTTQAHAVVIAGTSYCCLVFAGLVI